MSEKISVEDALKKGDRMLKYPLGIYLFILILSCSVLLQYTSVGVLYIALGFMTGVFVAQVYQSAAMTRWRIWAFERVGNIQELQSVAVLENFIYQDNSFFSKFEIRTASDKSRLAAINEQLKAPQAYKDDQAVPDETKIYKTGKLYRLKDGVVLIFAAVLPLGVTPTALGRLIIITFFVSIMVGVPSFLLDRMRQRKNKAGQPVVVFSNEGIWTTQSGFIRWTDVKNDIVKGLAVKKNRDVALMYEYTGGMVRIDTACLKIEKRTLIHILYIYRNRYEQKRNG